MVICPDIDGTSLRPESCEGLAFLSMDAWRRIFLPAVRKFTMAFVHERQYASNNQPGLTGPRYPLCYSNLPLLAGMVFRTSWIVVYLALLHLVGIYLFTRGFLLSRLSLSTVSECSSTSAELPCTLPRTHKRAVFLVIDSLRFDFLSPHPPEPHSPYHHNVLNLPRELTVKHPLNSFLFNAYADPPTATLQRIKGLVTGSLPTFVDIGHNFGGASIAEDSIIQQLQRANRTVCP